MASDADTSFLGDVTPSKTQETKSLLSGKTGKSGNSRSNRSHKSRGKITQDQLGAEAMKALDFQVDKFLRAAQGFGKDTEKNGVYPLKGVSLTYKKRF